MALSRSNEIRHVERLRAAGIIKEYEDELRVALAARPHAKNGEQVIRLLDKLELIRKQIMGAYVHQYIQRQKDGDFSLDEIAAAEEMINETK